MNHQQVPSLPVVLTGAAPSPKSFTQLRILHRARGNHSNFFLQTKYPGLLSPKHISHHLLCAYWCFSSLPKMPSQSLSIFNTKLHYIIPPLQSSLPRPFGSTDLPSSKLITLIVSFPTYLWMYLTLCVSFATCLWMYLTLLLKPHGCQILFIKGGAMQYTSCRNPPYTHMQVLYSVVIE